jgi:hypothetical protein
MSDGYDSTLGYRGCTCGLRAREKPHKVGCPLRGSVACVWCTDLGKHPDVHYWPGCTCAAAGFGLDHSSHCDLWGFLFLGDDRALSPLTMESP